MLGTHDHDPANPDLKYLGSAPVRSSRYRIPAQSPAYYMQSQTFVTPNGRTPHQVESGSTPDASSTPSLETEADVNLSPKSTSPAERKFWGQAPARAQATQITEMLTLQVSSDRKSQSAAAHSARKADVRDSEHRTSMHMLLQQLDEMSVSKQRITEEFRASQQLTAQALRRLDEECERRQQLQLRVMETEAALKILGRICEEKTEELASVHAKLEMSECRALQMEKQMAAHSACGLGPSENKIHNDLVVAATSTQVTDTDLNVRFLS